MLTTLKKILSLFARKKDCEHENRTLVASRHVWNGYEGDVYFCSDCKRHFKIVNKIHWDPMSGSPCINELELLHQGKLMLEER